MIRGARRGPPCDRGSDARVVGWSRPGRRATPGLRGPRSPPELGRVAPASGVVGWASSTSTRAGVPTTRSRDVRRAAASRTSSRACVEERDPFSGVGHGEPDHFDPQRSLVLALHLAHLAEHVSGGAEHRGVTVAGDVPQPARVGPRAAMHRTGPPPRPDLFGDEREVGCEEAQQGVEGEDEGGARRRGRVPGAPVGALLDQLDVVVAEPPEEPFGALERAGVVVVVERRMWSRSRGRRGWRAGPGRGGVHAPGAGVSLSAPGRRA